MPIRSSFCLTCTRSLATFTCEPVSLPTMPICRLTSHSPFMQSWLISVVLSLLAIRGGVRFKKNVLGPLCVFPFSYLAELFPFWPQCSPEPVAQCPQLIPSGFLHWGIPLFLPPYLLPSYKSLRKYYFLSHDFNALIFWWILLKFLTSVFQVLF